jgi:DNA-binding beta-propeller fold protein YncE
VSLSRFCAFVLAVAVGFPPAVARGIHPDSLQARLGVSAIAYDDGFGTFLKEPSGLWLDTAAGELLVADAGNGRVVIYDLNLTAQYSFRHYVRDPVSGYVYAGQPRGLAVTSNGDILLVDAVTDRLDLLDFRGRELDFVWPNRLVGDSTLRLKASCVAVDAADRFYVVVNGDLTTILVLDSDLRLIRRIGERGDSAHHLNTPVGIGVFEGRVYVGDLYGLPAVKVFDTLGQYQFGFGSHDVERDDLTFPGGFGFLDDDSGSSIILVMDGLRQVVKAYDEAGGFLAMIGGHGRQPGQFQYPGGLVSDGHTTFYVVERAGRRVQRYQLR